MNVVLVGALPINPPSSYGPAVKTTASRAVYSSSNLDKNTVKNFSKSMKLYHIYIPFSESYGESYLVFTDTLQSALRIAERYHGEGAVKEEHGDILYQEIEIKKENAGYIEWIGQGGEVIFEGIKFKKVKKSEKPLRY